LYAFSVLPVNLAGLALILFAIALFIAEIKVVSHGLLAVGGAIALIAGSLLLFSGHGEGTGYRVDLGIVVPGVIVTLAIVGLLSYKTIQLRMLPARTGASAMLGAHARVVDGFLDGRGRVQIHGEYWDAAGPAGLSRGEVVTVTRVDGMSLAVERRVG
jgi:membrane-bound serine protease (ClpP class)